MALAGSWMDRYPDAGSVEHDYIHNQQVDKQMASFTGHLFAAVCGAGCSGFPGSSEN
jgi:hypothetical protein